MARSEAIWVVVDVVRGEPVRAFTVKYELCRWLVSDGASIRWRLSILRMPDGYSYNQSDPTEYMLEEILEWGKKWDKMLAES